ncbi:hypothetical protein LNKW23_00870 [Paralimibaculum aggregatum]|uniref:Translation initiation factor IF-2 n=1 Tax=Paralimibaculum aggregatum TaxID=3036245 RepID=A0ABQ6LKQ8_9RHOB|nr:translation initiation factor IF-2 [Limibaculum sp. NKW23]GMG80875.1 hypothetical protein LNKW23_00870 [Limibaculum sp. NKW23]
MSDTDSGDKKPAARGGRGGPGGGRGGGRPPSRGGATKPVVVEKKRKRVLTAPGSGGAAGAAQASGGAASVKTAASVKSTASAGQGGASVATKSRPQGAEAGRADSAPARSGGGRADGGSGGNRRGGGGQAAGDAPRGRGQNRGGKPQMLRSLSDEEYARRLEALKQAKKHEEEARRRAVEDAKRRAEEEAKQAAEDAKRAAEEAAEAKRREAEEAEAKRREAEEAEAKRTAAEEAERREKAERQRAAEAAAGATPAPLPGEQAAPKPKRAAAAEGQAASPASPRSKDDGDDGRGRNKPMPQTKKREKEQPTPNKGRGEDKRRTGRLTISKLGGDEDGRQRSLAAMRRRQEREKRKSRGHQETREKVIRDVTLPEVITVQELANRMAERVADVIKALMKNDIMATQNQSIDQDTAELIIEEFGHRVKRVSEADVEQSIESAEDSEGDLEPRAPVVTIMGHVDHGKTSLLDALRKTNVVAGEAGGITQHIGAYQINTEAGAKITFLDTPGHAAFTSMRARGAQVTDIVILVVAADDSVMPQTIEAISHAKAAEVPMIVAINKIDKPGADANQVRTELLRHEIVVEGMGGDVLDVEVSALTGQGLDTLVENITLQSELLELKANPGRPAEGAVIEAKLDVGRGPVATVLVQRGTLRTGDIFVVGEQWGKVRALINDQGERITEAGPSVPVEVLGLNGTPEAGDVLNVVEDEAKAREIADYRHRKAREKVAAAGSRASLDQLLAQAKSDENVSELPIVVKADVQGSTEAIVQALEKIGNDEVRIQILHSGVGAITESDVNLAEASGAPIIGFNVRANAPARNAANQKGVEIRYYSIIYDLVDDVKAAASGLLSPEVQETFIGYAEIKQVFKVSGVGKVAGCQVTEGVARRSAGVRLLRDNVVIHEGTLKTLKRFKDEVKEVPVGQECGMAFENYEDIREGDVIEIFERKTVERTL